MPVPSSLPTTPPGPMWSRPPVRSTEHSVHTLSSYVCTPYGCFVRGKGKKKHEKKHTTHSRPCAPQNLPPYLHIYIPRRTPTSPKLLPSASSLSLSRPWLLPIIHFSTLRTFTTAASGLSPLTTGRLCRSFQKRLILASSTLNRLCPACQVRPRLGYKTCPVPRGNSPSSTSVMFEAADVFSNPYSSDHIPS